jgi:type IV secretion system protein VirB4
MAVVGVDGLPQESWPTMLSTLETLPLSYRWSTRFIFLDQYDATKEAESYRKGWQQQVFRFLDKFLNNPNARANRDAARMVEDAEEAIADIQGGTVSAGYLTTAIVLLDDDRDTVISHAKSLRGLLRNLGWGCRVESFNAVEAWQGTHPANTWANLRRPLVHTLNLAHMLPLSSVWRGRRHNPCPFYPPASPPLAVVTTDGSTPFYLNLHVGDVAHTLIVGPTGAGKSTLLAFLAYSFMRYAKAQIFAFDTGMSLYALCLAVKGQHYDIGNTDGLAFAPLRQIDTPVDRAWAAEWIAMLCQLQHMEIKPEHTNAIMEGLERLAGNPEHMRGLKEFWNLVPDTAIREALQHYTTLGSMGHLLDAQTDTLGLSHFTVFEIEELMNMGNANLLPIITYIFRRIEQALDGRPSLLLLDEAWIMLGHPAFRDKIREWLKVFRKKNCGVVLATQSLSDAKNSGIFDVLVESCPTKILLANPEARQSDQIALYRDLGCNERVIGQIAEATPKREYFAMSPEGRRMFQLALNPEQLAFLGVSDKHSIARIQALHTQYGPDGWQQHWLQERCA